MGDIMEQLQALHVWPQFVANTHADVISPRQAQGLYDVGNVASEAAAEIERLTEALQVIAVGEGCMNGIREELDAGSLRKIARAALGAHNYPKLALNESFERVAQVAKERDAFNEQMAAKAIEARQGQGPKGLDATHESAGRKALPET